MQDESSFHDSSKEPQQQQQHQRYEEQQKQYLYSYNEQNYDNDTNVKGSFYSVFVPGEIKPKGFEVCKYIFSDKLAALNFVKEMKKARFRHFESYNEALNFATYGLIEQPKRTNISDTTILKSATNNQNYGEKISLFKGPKSQELIKLRKAIENGDYDYVKNCIWENPRYLVSSGDTPSILQEGCRYNALHVAAKEKNAAAAELILSTISDDRFVRLLYGDDSYENIENRIQALLDLYLNTPDKGYNETPLHFASKYGAVHVVEVLVSFPQCDKSLKNKFGQTPDMIICDRSDQKDSNIKKQIGLLLRNSYYVPVLRAEDNSMPPVIGEPFSPGNSPVISKDPLSPRLEIHAYAGPMNKEGAEKFRKAWKTPPRTSTPLKKFNNTYNSKIDESLENVISLRFKDPSKGLERLGQKLANKFDVSWKEYWSFLDSFIDITSQEGLNLLENHLKQRSNIVDKSFNLLNENNVSTTTISTTKSLNNSNLNHSHNNSNNQSGGTSTISELCNAFAAFNLNDSFGGGDDDHNYHNQHNQQQHNINNVDDNFSPFLNVEKACNVFAKRIACDIIYRITKDFYGSIAALESQAKQVEVLITSYMEDQRFRSVNLKSLHSRLGELTAQKLSLCISPEDKNVLIEKLDEFLSESVEVFDYSSSDNEKLSSTTLKATSLKKQMICIIRHVFNKFNEEMRSLPELQEEIDCQEIWGKSRECGCIFHIKKTRKGLARNNSFKLNKYKTDFNCVSRKLFNNDENIRHTDLNVTMDNYHQQIDDERFYTPPSSPSCLSIDDDVDSDDDEKNEEYSEVQLLPEVFIEGDSPTKTDNAVFNAIKYAEITLDSQIYPNIYRWYHNVGLYSESERDSWRHSRKKPNDVRVMLTPCSNTGKNDHHTSTVTSPNTPTSKSWLRITGANSPRAVLKQPSTNKK